MLGKLRQETSHRGSHWSAATGYEIESRGLTVATTGNYSPVVQGCSTVLPALRLHEGDILRNEMLEALAVDPLKSSIARVGDCFLRLRQSTEALRSSSQLFLLSTQFHQSYADPNLYVRGDGVLILRYVAAILVLYADAIMVLVAASEKGYERQDALIRRNKMSQPGRMQRMQHNGATISRAR